MQVIEDTCCGGWVAATRSEPACRRAPSDSYHETYMIKIEQQRAGTRPHPHPTPPRDLAPDKDAHLTCPNGKRHAEAHTMPSDGTETSASARNRALPPLQAPQRVPAVRLRSTPVAHATWPSAAGGDVQRVHRSPLCDVAPRRGNIRRICVRECARTSACEGVCTHSIIQIHIRIYVCDAQHNIYILKPPHLMHIHTPRV